MSRVFQPAYTEPVPAGAERVLRWEEGRKTKIVPEAEGGPPTAEPCVRFRRRGKAVVAPLVAVDGALKCRRLSSWWWGEWRDGNGDLKKERLSRNEQAARAMLAERERLAERQRDGYLPRPGSAEDQAAGHAARRLLDHLADFEAELRQRGRTAKHVAQTVGRVRRLLDGCNFDLAADVEAGRAQPFLAGLQQAGPAADLSAEEAPFAPGALAKALGVARTTLAEVSDRQGLPVERVPARPPRDGEPVWPPHRRYPLATALALQALLCRGDSARTAACYLREAKSFFAWMVQDGRLTSNPLARLKADTAGAEVRRGRRPLTADELARLLDAARASDRPFRGLSGADRFVLYATAAGTGLREAELAALVPEWFALDAEPPTVALPARVGKNRKPTLQPLAPALAEALRDYLDGRPAGRPVWPGTWADVGAEMLRIDLAAAGVPYVVEGPDGPLFADLHSLRHTFVAMLDRAGVSLKQAMQLARHSDPRLTMARYGRAQLHDLGAAVERLSLPLPQAPAAEGLRATGKEGGGDNPCAADDGQRRPDDGRRWRRPRRRAGRRAT
jgi:integrase